MTQIRAVIRAKHRPTIDRLMAVTGAATTTDLIDIYITRCSRHLETTWILDEAQPVKISTSVPAPAPPQFDPSAIIKF
jgi:hypothetical protein